MNARITALVVLSPLVLSLPGCASTRSYTPINYCTAPINASMARIILKRHHALYAEGVPLKIFDDNQPIGAVGPGGRLCWDRYPGRALITGGGEAGGKYVVITAKPDTVYHVSVGMSGKWRLQRSR